MTLVYKHFGLPGYDQVQIVVDGVMLDERITVFDLDQLTRYYKPESTLFESGSICLILHTPLTVRNQPAKTGKPMNAKFPPKKLLCLRLAAVVLALVPAFAHAQDPFATPPPADPLAGVSVHVLDQQQVEFGTHIITYNRILPPVFPAPTPTPTPADGPTTNGANHAPQTRGVKHSTHTNDAGEGEKPYKTLFLSATVYDHQFTALRFYGGNSPELSAYVNIDFNYFRGVNQIETADAVYMIMFGMGDDTVASLTQAGQQPPNLAAFPQGYSACQIIAGDTTAHAEDLAALDALCLYYDDHKAQMIADYNQREADNAAHQQWLIDHPPVKPDTVIYFWPMKGSAYLNQAH